MNHLWLSPFHEGLSKYTHVTRRIADRLSKNVEITIEKNSPRVRRHSYKGILSAFIHLIRNAVDHGIEDPESRLFSGKPETGQIRVFFETLPDRTVFRVHVEDDGRGIDVEMVREKARHKAAISDSNMNAMTPNEILNRILLLNFSLRSESTEEHASPWNCPCSTAWRNCNTHHRQPPRKPTIQPHNRSRQKKNGLHFVLQSNFKEGFFWLSGTVALKSRGKVRTPGEVAPSVPASLQ